MKSFAVSTAPYLYLIILFKKAASVLWGRDALIHASKSEVEHLIIWWIIHTVLFRPFFLWNTIHGNVTNQTVFVEQLSLCRGTRSADAPRALMALVQLNSFSRKLQRLFYFPSFGCADPYATRWICSKSEWLRREKDGR